MLQAAERSGGAVREEKLCCSGRRAAGLGAGDGAGDDETMHTGTSARFARCASPLSPQAPSSPGAPSTGSSTHVAYSIL